MAQIGELNTFIDGTELEAFPLQENYAEIVNKYNEHDSAITDIHGVVSPDYIISKQYVDETIDKYYPIGVVRLCWEGTEEARILSSSNKYQEFNGVAVNNIYSRYYNKVLPDLDQAFFVGIDTAVSVANSVVGSNVKDFSHVHTHQHTHQIAAHIHQCAHRHFLFDYAYAYVNFRSDGHVFTRDGTTTFNPTSSYYFDGGTDGEVQTMTAGLNIMGDTNYNTYGIPNKTAFNTDNPLNSSSTNTTASGGFATYDIRAKYFRVKAYLRII